MWRILHQQTDYQHLCIINHSINQLIKTQLYTTMCRKQIEGQTQLIQ